ncbi:hypothetical protein CXB49_20100 [Chromobacterium sp. ATCC 53434]|uniref:hypothetical protein n=1 Tax=Chromobacterium sp. (strain ATCC 53434 / SC 14030) TaxID=2059672 RepID=UPI000C76840E|nr:hypothetical protein [Chromobacterium sp. ATCC 53434]AUH52923.1 hypothetical protein CXB49_20100 [Chromobacterium sp. ATCC 53434]
MTTSITARDGDTFGRAWWRDFIDRTDSLSQPIVIRDLFPAERLDFYTRKVLEVLATVKTTQYGYRAFVDGRQLGPADMEDLFKKVPEDDETLEAWAQRAFDGRNFGIILNNSDKFNEALASDVASSLAPFFAEIGHPRGGVQTTIFIGNYDQTPIGIHQDDRGESVLHFHVGPADKTMYVWDKDEYEALLKDKNWTKKDVEALKPYARAYSFSAGDLYYMPEGTYHLGEQDGLSIGITIWTYCHTDDLLVQNLHQQMLKQIPVKKTPDFHHDNRPLDDTSGLDDIVRKYAVTDECKHLNYGDLLRAAYQDWRYGIHSNGGYRNKPMPRADDDKADFQPGDLLRLEAPYRILIRESIATEKMYLYVRCEKIEFRYFACLIPFIERINRGEAVRVDALLALLDPSWPPRIGLHLLNELYRCRGVAKL